MVQSFTYRPEYAHGRYISRIVPINFAEAVNVADPEKEETINVPFKTYAGNQLAQIIESGGLAFSELDSEGISQIERIAKQKSPSGVDRFFIMSDKGTGVSTDDHIFASYITFMGALNAADAPTVKKLGMAATGKTNK